MVTTGVGFQKRLRDHRLDNRVESLESCLNCLSSEDSGVEVENCRRLVESFTYQCHRECQTSARNLLIGEILNGHCFYVIVICIFGVDSESKLKGLVK